MTEEEARTKWCPFAKSRVVECVNSDGDTETSCIQKGGKLTVSCIGSACMAWRWDQSRIGRNDAGLTKIEAIREYRAEHRSDLQTAKEAVERAWSEPKTVGYCGLAGEPK